MARPRQEAQPPALSVQVMLLDMPPPAHAATARFAQSPCFRAEGTSFLLSQFPCHQDHNGITAPLRASTAFFLAGKSVVGQRAGLCV